MVASAMRGIGRCWVRCCNAPREVESDAESDTKSDYLDAKSALSSSDSQYQDPLEWDSLLFPPAQFDGDNSNSAQEIPATTGGATKIPVTKATQMSSTSLHAESPIDRPRVAAVLGPAGSNNIAEEISVTTAANGIPVTTMPSKEIPSPTNHGPRVAAELVPATSTNHAEEILVTSATKENSVTTAVSSNPTSQQEKSLPRASGILGLVIHGFRVATVLGPAGDVTEVHRSPFIDSLEICAGALDKMGASMGNCLRTNTKKLRASKADAAEASYRSWLLSELPVHATTGFKNYADASAWMANLWIGWSLEFVVEMFALLQKGDEAKTAFEKAYRRTLSTHHNFFQRTAFNTAVRGIPSRKAVFEQLRGDSEVSCVLEDMAAFLALGRPLVKFCLQVNVELETRMQAARADLARK